MKTRDQIAYDALFAKANATIASTKSDRLDRLAGWKTENAELLSRTSTTEQNQLNARVDAALDRALTVKMREMKAEVSTFGSGMAAVDAESEWYRRLTNRFPYALNRPATLDAIAAVRSRRGADLVTAGPDLVARIYACPTNYALNAYRDELLRIPGAEGHAALIYDPVAVRRAQLIHESEKADAAAEVARQASVAAAAAALLSPSERKCTDSPGHFNVALWHDQPPDADDIRTGLLRSLAHANGEILDPHSATFVVRSPILMVPNVYVMHIDEISNVQVTTVGTNAYRCRFKQVCHLSLREGQSDDYDMMQTIRVRQWNALMAPTWLHTEQSFQIYNDGWGVPDLRDRGEGESAVNGYLKVFGGGPLTH